MPCWKESEALHDCLLPTCSFAMPTTWAKSGLKSTRTLGPPQAE